MAGATSAVTRSGHGSWCLLPRRAGTSLKLRRPWYGLLLPFFLVLALRVPPLYFLVSYGETGNLTFQWS